MRSALVFVTDFWSLAWQMTRAGVINVTSHWALAAFSLVAAFGVWMAIQDVENPRAQGLAPVSGGIEVEALNIPQGFLVDDIAPVKVEVEARESVIPELQPGDFKATVDTSQLGQGVRTGLLPVRVTVTGRDGVRVLDVTPNQVQVQLIEAAEKEFEVAIRRTTPLPAGYEESEPPTVDPFKVTVRGRPERVQSVRSVEFDVSLAGIRQDATVEGELIARTVDGNPVQVQLSQPRARATFHVVQVVSTRTVALNAVITGEPQEGFAISGVVVEPQTVVVTGPTNVIDSLGTRLDVEPVDVTGARQEVVKTARIVRPDNISIANRDTPTVVVRVQISPIEVTAVRWLAPELADMPTGLAVQPGTVLSVPVRVTGPLGQVRGLKIGDIKVTLSLSGAKEGPADYSLRLEGPQGLRLEADPVRLTLVQAAAP
ncbi:MAG: CdaR family protein [Dehalococcoidia bacterium]|nr:CdaR family protein [Dehalococcoidia bacterium]